MWLPKTGALIEVEAQTLDQIHRNGEAVPANLENYVAGIQLVPSCNAAVILRELDIEVPIQDGARTDVHNHGEGTGEVMQTAHDYALKNGFTRIHTQHVLYGIAAQGFPGQGMNRRDATKYQKGVEGGTPIVIRAQYDALTGECKMFSPGFTYSQNLHVLGRSHDRFLLDESFYVLDPDQSYVTPGKTDKDTPVEVRVFVREERRCSFAPGLISKA